MSYNYAYGQPQQPMVAALPYPSNQLLSQPMPIPAGSPPFTPNPQYLPQPFHQVYPLIVSEAMNALSAKASNNPLRVFLYNQTSANFWNNQDFLAFIDGLIRLIEVKMATGAFRDIQQCIGSCADYFAELNAAANFIKFPALGEGMGPNEVMQVKAVINDLQATMGEIDRFYRQGGAMQQQPQQQWNNPANYMPPQQQQPQAWSRHQARGTTNWRQVQQVQQITQGAVAAVNTTRGYGNVQPEGAAVVGSRYSRQRQAPQAPQVQPRVAQHDSREQAQQHARDAMMGNVPGKEQAPAQVQTTASDGKSLLVPSAKVPFVPNDRYSVNLAYDPNIANIFYKVDAEGIYVPSLSKKADIDMDMSKHLTTPRFAPIRPAALETVDSKVRILMTEKSVVDDVTKTNDTELRIEEELEKQRNASSVSMEELWLNNEVSLAIQRKTTKRVNAHRAIYVSQMPLVTTMNPKSMINAVAQCETFEAACKVMRTFRSQLAEGACAHGDDKTLSFINKRLTERLNGWLKKSLAVAKGWVDSFIDDAPAVPKFISDRVGPNFGAKVVEAQAMIISSALQYSEQDLEDSLNSNLLSEVDNMEKLIKEVTVTYFYERLTLTSLDLYSPELRFDLPEGCETSVGVFSTITPLLRKIADGIFTYERAVGGRFDRHLVRTADGVTLEFMLSPMNPDFYLVIPVDN